MILHQFLIKIKIRKKLWIVLHEKISEKPWKIFREELQVGLLSIVIVGRTLINEIRYLVQFLLNLIIIDIVAFFDLFPRLHRTKHQEAMHGSPKKQSTLYAFILQSKYMHANLPWKEASWSETVYIGTTL